MLEAELRFTPRVGGCLGSNPEDTMEIAGEVVEVIFFH